VAKIKLLNIGNGNGNTIRLQSQLSVGTDTADFILEDGVLKCWSYGVGGQVGFHETDIPYEIYEKKEEMRRQEL